MLRAAALRAWLALVRRTASFASHDYDQLVEARERGESAVVAGWHAGMLPFLLLPRVRPGREYLLVAAHPAAAAIARLAGMCGLRALPLASGPSQRRGLDHAERLLREPGTWVVVAVDGPFGPANRVRPGACALAARAGVPIVPLRVAAEPCWTAATWDRRVYPKVGARIRCQAGRHIRPPGRSGRSARTSVMESVQRELDALAADALR